MSEFQKIKQQLIDMREEILDNIAQDQKKTKEISLDKLGDEGDHASQERAQELYRLFSKREQKKLNAIDEALNKINQGDYGECEECGEEIESKRLEVVPFARFCFDCQSTMEITYSSDLEEDDYSDISGDDKDVI